MTTAYLRSDLWAKSCIYQAEGHLKDPEAVVHVLARVHFVRAAVTGAITTVIYALATAILLVPHVLATLGSGYGNLCLCRKIRLAFYLAEGRLEGSVAATAVALFSLVWTGCSVWVSDTLNARLDANWTSFKQNLATQIHQHVADVKEKRLASVNPDEVYLPYGAGSQPYYVILADELEQRMLAHCNSFSLGNVVEGKYERYETAMNEIDRFMSRRSYELYQLPLTFPEIGPWRIQQAANLKSKALGFLSQQADREASRRQATYPNKFNKADFYRNVAGFKEAIQGELEAHIAQIRAKQTDLADRWRDGVAVHTRQQKQLQGQLTSLQNTAANAQWWRDRLSLMPDFILEFLENRASTAQAEANGIAGQLAQVNSRRAAAIHSIAYGIFLDFNNKVFKLEHSFNSLVDAGGRIQKRVSYLARPAWYSSIWRTVSPALSWFPSWQKSLENALDPDV